MTKILAINGGQPLRKNTNYFPQQNDIGEEEKEAVMNVLDTGKLSGFRGNWIAQFWGGQQVNNFEAAWSRKFKKNLLTIATNSCTSALFLACGALRLKPGDEVIVTPWSMSCSASVPLWYGATPVFADIEPDYFCLKPSSVEGRITKNTKAIIVVDLFGQPYNVEEINAIGKKYNIPIIEDAAQAPGAMYKDKYTGDLADMGCFSFTQGKHMTCGEGGLLTTNDHEYELNAALIRNHAEAVVNAMPEDTRNANNNHDMKGLNLRMTEIQAAIMQVQLNKLDSFIERRQKNALILNKMIGTIPCIKPAKVRPDCTHTYYVLPFHYDQKVAGGIHRDTFINAVKAELSEEAGRPDKGVAIGNGYIKPLYRMPIFNRNYKLPVVEKLWRDELFITTLHGNPLAIEDTIDIAMAFHKVWEHRKELK